MSGSSAVRWDSSAQATFWAVIRELTEAVTSATFTIHQHHPIEDQGLTSSNSF
jgi:hypothetical protein